MYGFGGGWEAHANARLECACSERGLLCRRRGPESAVALSGSAVCGAESWERGEHALSPVEKQRVAAAERERGSLLLASLVGGPARFRGLARERSLNLEGVGGHFTAENMKVCGLLYYTCL